MPAKPARVDEPKDTNIGAGNGYQQSRTLVDPQMPQDAGQQEPGGSQLAVPDGSPVMPENIIIGTANAFHVD